MTPRPADQILSALGGFVEEGNAPRARAAVEEALGAGLPAWDILNRGIMPALRLLGEGLKDGSISLAEVMISVGAVKAGLGLLEPLLVRTMPAGQGVVVIGTVIGDVHSLGKDLVVTMLRGAGFQVVDLGADVSAARFVEAATRHGANIVAMSGLLTSSRLAMRDIIAALEKAGLRRKLAVLVGGGAVDRQNASAIGADAYGEDAGVAVDLAVGLLARA